MNSQLSTGMRLRSVDGLDHVLLRRLGAGGQGEVWLTRGERRIVKVCYDERRAAELRSQFNEVKSLKLEGLHVARPLSLLAPPLVGYVAEFLSEMAPMSTLLRPPAETSLADWHRETGGLRRRLRLLAHIAEAVSGLHDIGYSYGDLSDTNVMISALPSFEEAWLIDLDNVTCKARPSSSVFTPHYAAPELERRTGSSSTLTDAWSFAVLACWTLTLGHPFIGDRVDEDADLEAPALAGELPWIGDTEDTSNPTTRGLPLDMVLSPGLRQLAQRTFGLAGRNRPGARATVGEWASALHLAADRTIDCHACAATFYDRAAACPWCDAPRPAHGRLEFFAWDPDRPAAGRTPAGPILDENSLRAIANFDTRPESTMTIPERLTHLSTGLKGRGTTLHLRATTKGVLVTPANDACVWLQDRSSSKGAPQAALRRLPERGALLGPGDQWIHFGSETETHRVATIKMVPKASR